MDNGHGGRHGGRQDGRQGGRHGGRQKILKISTQSMR